MEKVRTHQSIVKTIALVVGPAVCAIVFGGVRRRISLPADVAFSGMWLLPLAYLSSLLTILTDQGRRGVFREYLIIALIAAGVGFTWRATIFLFVSMVGGAGFVTLTMGLFAGFAGAVTAAHRGGKVPWRVVSGTVLSACVALATNAA